MQFSTSALAIAALSIGSAVAQTDASGSVTVHVVTVGYNGTLTFMPDNLVAAAGSMVQFQFAPKNHSVVQSSFDNPCEPNAGTVVNGTTVAGLFSGYMPVAADATSVPTYTIMINNTKPIWLYCSQAKHCESGMSMVINENTTANASRSLANYKTAASSVALSGAPDTGVTDGTDSSIPSASAAAPTGPSSTTTGSTTQSTNAAASLRVGSVLGLIGGLAAVFALL